MSDPVARHGYTISRTIEALQVLSQRPVSPRELARTLRVHPRTARRMLARLAYDGYAVRGAEGYVPTIRLRALGITLAGQPLSDPQSVGFDAATAPATGLSED